MAERLREKSTLAFLRELWPDGIPAGSALALFRLGTNAHRHVRDLAEAARLLDAGAFTNFGCSLVRVDVQGRGGAGDAVAIPGLWLDLDLAGGAHAERALPTREEALDFIDTLPLRPTLVLHSGGGLYLWWAFREPWTFDSAPERHRAQVHLRGWQAFILEQAAAHGWRLDNTSSLAQLLRAEGSLNTKYAPPRAVQRIRTGGPRWNPGDFEEWRAQGADRSRTPTELPRELEPWLARAIEGLDVETRVARRDGAIHAIVLQLCPVCGGVQQTRRGLATWTAHIAPLSGALRCKRQSCEAHESTDGGGFEAPLWASRFLAPAVAAEVQRLQVGAEPRAQDAGQPEPNTCTLAEADAGKVAEVIDEAIAFAQSGRRIALAVIPLGAGKTRAIVDRLERHRGAYFARNHKLLDEVARELERRGVPFTRVEGVGTACHFKAAFEHYGRRNDWRGTACRTCPHLADGSCRAGDVPKGTVILATHASLPVLHGMRVVDADTGETHPVLADRLVVMDEGAGFVEMVRVDRQGLRVPLDNPGAFGTLATVAEKATSLIDALLARCIRHRLEDSERNEFPTRYGGEKLSLLWPEVIEGWDPEQVQYFLGSAANIQSRSWPRPHGQHLREAKLDPTTLSHPDLMTVWRLLPGVVLGNEAVRKRDEVTLGRLEVVVTDDNAWVEIRAAWRIPLGRKNGVVVLDATGRLTLAELQAANPRTKIREFTLNVLPNPEARLLRAHVATWSVSRKRLLKDGALTPRAVGTLGSALREVSKLAQEHIGAGRHRCGLLTYKAIADLLVQDAALRQLVVPSGLELSAEMIGYYNRDERGSNQFSGVPVLVTFGDPVPHIGAAEADGRALGVPAQELIDARTLATLVQAHGRSRALRARGAVLQVHVGHVRLPGWEDCKVLGLPPGRPPSDVRERVRGVVELLLKSGDVATVPVVSALASGRVMPEEGLFRTAYESLIGSFAQTPPVLPATLHRWISDVAAGLGATSSPGRVPDSAWTVWHMPTMSASEVVVRARRWWRILQARDAAAGSEEVEWSA